MTKRSRRQFLGDSLLAAATAVPLTATTSTASHSRSRRKASPNEILRVGVVGVRGRGRGHVKEFVRSKDTEVVAICDADKSVIKGAMKAAPDAKYYQDIRRMLEDDSIDIVSIATPNHWHSLAAIWALQAGKHVYVEKPLSHNVLEGRALVEAALASGKLVQHGTQSRSSQATRDAMQWLHEGGLGKIDRAIALCYKPRGSIGKVDGPQPVPESCDYDLWTGPADLEPLHRKQLHYDWHWDFNTGNGDMGNQGVHQMDIARWGLGLDALPQAVQSCGGRFGYVDDGDTPNTQISNFDYGDKRIVFEVRGLKTERYHGAKIGVVFHGENGYLVSASYSKVLAFDPDGVEIKKFEGGGNHFHNFIDAVKAGDASKLNANVVEGHLSSALCHLGNVSYFLGRDAGLDNTERPFGHGEAAANESYQRFCKHLAANKVDAAKTTMTLGPRLEFDAGRERFTGPSAHIANPLLSRAYRGEFAVPRLVANSALPTAEATARRQQR